MKNRPEGNAKVARVTRLESKSVDVENLVSGRPHLCVGGSDVSQSTMLKEIFSRRSTRDVQKQGLRTWSKRKSRRRVMLIGLDCAAPELVFDRWLDDFPNLKSLYDSGLHGSLRSCDPPITVPAWSVMMSSKSPGLLGVYGFRNRADHSYDTLFHRQFACD